MCGIMGYVGPQEAAPILVDGLRRLEYRGYDSAGIAVANGSINVRKAQGKITNLEELLESKPLEGSIGIGHTRWATHGAPTDLNAHPHPDPSGEFVVVHNGIIENFQSLKDELASSGARFMSETDTEVLAHLVAREYDGDLVEAVRKTVALSEGAYAMVVMSKADPGTIVAVRKISPLVVGLGEGETFLASDIPAVLHHTRDFLVIEDDEMVIVTKDGATVETITGDPVDREVTHITWDAEQAEKGGYDHFMLKEIHEQPAVITETLAGRLDENGHVWLEDVAFDDAYAESIGRVWITACGTGVPRGAHRPGDLPEGAAPPGQRRIRPRVAIRRSDRRPQRAHDRHQPIRRDGRHVGCRSASDRPGRPDARHHERRRLDPRQICR